jgi:hypothetical protein
MIDLSKYRFSNKPFTDKRDLAFRYRAVCKLVEDSNSIGHPMEILDYPSVKEMKFESIRIYFQELIKIFANNYSQHIAENL